MMRKNCMKKFKSRFRLMTAVVLSTGALWAAARSKGVPSGWIEDFEVAKATSAKEGKHILICCVASDGYWGDHMLRQVFAQGKFSGKAKKKFVLMMVDLARDVKNLSPTAINQNSKLQDDYQLWPYSGPRIVDCDGVLLKRIDRIEGDAISYWVKLEAETRDLPAAEKRKPSAAAPSAAGTNGTAKAKASRGRTGNSPAGSKKDNSSSGCKKVPEEPISRVPGTGKSTPAGWMDDFYAAQEIARRENKLIFAVFSGSDWCGWCKVYSEKVLSVPKFIRAVRDRYVLVYVDSPRDESLLTEKCREQNKTVKQMLGAGGGVPHTVICTPDAEKMASISGCNKFAQKGAESFLEYFNGLDGALKTMHEAKAKIKDMDETSAEAVKIIHEALQRIDEEVMVANFMDDAEFVVAQDKSLIHEYPYLEFVRPILEKFRALRMELNNAADDAARKNGRVQYNEYSAARRKLFAEKGYRMKYKALLKDVDAALGNVSKASTRKALLDVKAQIYGELNSR